MHAVTPLPFALFGFLSFLSLLVIWATPTCGIPWQQFAPTHGGVAGVSVGNGWTPRPTGALWVGNVDLKLQFQRQATYSNPVCGFLNGDLSVFSPILLSFLCQAA